MSPGARASVPSPVATLLDCISRLHGAASQQDFYHCLEQVLREVLGIGSFTVAGMFQGECRVLHTTRRDTLRDRLLPPRIDADRLLDLAAEVPGYTTSSVLAARSIAIEGEEAPVFDLWRFGVGGFCTAFLLFHEVAPDRDSERLSQLVPELHRNASLAFFKIADREQLQEQLDLYQAKLQAINEVGEMIGSLDIDVLLSKLMELSLYIVGGEIGSVILVDSHGSGVANEVEWGFPVEMARSFVDREGRVLYERVIDEQAPLLVVDFGAECEFRVEGYDLQVSAYLCIPLISKGKCLGAINLIDPGSEGRRTAFSPLDQEILMTISGLVATTIENAILHEDSLDKQRYEQSLAIAHDIQARMYPSRAPDVDTLDIAWKSQACDETGGDYFDFIPRVDGTPAVAIGDVSGHGIGAALIMASARAGLRATLSHGDELASAFERLNRQLERDMEMERFMTLFTASLGDGSERLRYVNAGHDAPCLWRAATGEVEELHSTGIPLGLFPTSSYRVGETEPMRSGDVLLLTTDGVWEVQNPTGQMLGKERLIAFFRNHARRPAAEIVAAVLADVAAFTSVTPARDDVTIVALRCR